MVASNNEIAADECRQNMCYFTSLLSIDIVNVPVVDEFYYLSMIWSLCFREKFHFVCSTSFHLHCTRSVCVLKCWLFGHFDIFSNFEIELPWKESSFLYRVHIVTAYYFDGKRKKWDKIIPRGCYESETVWDHFLISIFIS